MKPTRAAQPFRRGARAPSAALAAMTKGRAVGGMNPADTQRAVQSLTRAGKQGKRPTRPARPPR